MSAAEIELAKVDAQPSGLIPRSVGDVNASANRAPGLPGLQISLNGAADGFIALPDSDSIGDVIAVLEQIRTAVTE